MDPRLWKVVENGDGDEVVAVVMRLRPGAVPPPQIRTVARFGDVITCRLRRNRLLDVYADQAVVSMKAPGLVVGTGVGPAGVPELAAGRPMTRQRAPSVGVSGRGCVVGVVDFGLDFTHPNFGNRRLMIWDQRPGGGPRAPQPYGYGVVHSARAIERALGASDPFGALGYDLAADERHGTFVTDVAAGTPRVGPGGVAFGADIAFVHLSMPYSSPRRIGNSVSLLEGLDWIRRVAGGQRPWVANLSIGSTMGPKDGSSLVEQSIDALVASTPGQNVICSVGNYRNRSIHAAGTVQTGERVTLDWIIDPTDETPNELEIWYPGTDALIVRLLDVDGSTLATATPDSHGPIVCNGETVGQFASRTRDPNNEKNHVYLSFDPGEGGDWRIMIEGLRVQRGGYDVWIERDEVHAGSQSRLRSSQAARSTTLGTICGGHLTIGVGAYNASTGAPAPFSSEGPTADLRMKPEIVAEGVKVVGARSAQPDGPDRYNTVMTGTSMAAPVVAGTVALLYEAAGRPLSAQEVRRILFETADPIKGAAANRVGHGRLRIKEAVELAARTASGPGATHRTPKLSSPARMFDALARAADQLLPERLERVATVVGWPGRPLSSPVQRGDLVVVRALGEGALGGTGIVEWVLGNEVGVRDLLVKAGSSPIAGRPTARWILGEGSTLRPDVAVLRPRRRPHADDVPLPRAQNAGEGTGESSAEINHFTDQPSQESGSQALARAQETRAERTLGNVVIQPREFLDVSEKGHFGVSTPVADRLSHRNQARDAPSPAESLPNQPADEEIDAPVRKVLPDEDLVSRFEFFRVRVSGTGWLVTVPTAHEWTKSYTERALAIAALAAAVRRVFGGTWSMDQFIKVENGLPQHRIRFTEPTGTSGQVTGGSITRAKESAVRIDDITMEHVRATLRLFWKEADPTLRREHFLGTYLDQALQAALRRWDEVAQAFPAQVLAQHQLTVSIISWMLRARREGLIEVARFHPATRDLVRSFDRDGNLRSGDRRAGEPDFTRISASRWSAILLDLVISARQLVEANERKRREDLRRSGEYEYLRPHEITVQNRVLFILQNFSPNVEATLNNYGLGWRVRGGQRVGNLRNQQLFLLSMQAGQAVYFNEADHKFYRQSLAGLEHEMVFGVFTQVAEKTRDIIPMTKFILSVTGALFPVAGIVFTAADVLNVANRVHLRQDELIQTYRRLYIACTNIESKVPGLQRAIAIAALGTLARVVEFQSHPDWSAWFVAALKVLRRAVVARARGGFAPEAAESVLRGIWQRLNSALRTLSMAGPAMVASVKSIELSVAGGRRPGEQPLQIAQEAIGVRLQAIGVPSAMPLAIRIASLPSSELEGLFNEIMELIDSGDEMMRLIKDITSW